jgi:hypothetical protein
VTCKLGDSRQIRARKDANRERHVEARLFDVLGERIIIIVDGMLVNFSIDMPMRDDVTMSSIVSVVENEAEVVVTGISGRRLRCGNEHALQRNSYRGRHHHYDGQTPQDWPTR